MQHNFFKKIQNIKNFCIIMQTHTHMYTSIKNYCSYIIYKEVRCVKRMHITCSIENMLYFGLPILAGRALL